MTTTQPTTSPTRTHLLYLDASPRGERSASRRLGAKFLRAWQAAHPGATVVTRDIGREPPPFITEAWVEGAFAPAATQSDAARAAIAASNRYVDEFLAAEQIVIATPIFNLSVPAALKAWIDQIVRIGRTFAKTPTGFEGLARGKRLLVIATSGGDVRPHTPGGAYNFLEPYLRGIFGFIGVTQVEFVYAHSTAAAEATAASAAASAEATLTELASMAA